MQWMWVNKQNLNDDERWKQAENMIMKIAEMFGDDGIDDDE